MDQALVVFVVATFLCVALLILSLRGIGEANQLVAERLERHDRGMAGGVGAGVTAPGSGVLRDTSLSSFSLLDRLLRAGSFAEGIALDLARANVSLRVAEYLLMRAFIALGLALIARVAGLPWPILVMGTIAGFYLPKFYISHLEQVRVSQFNDQLMDAISMIARSLRSGFSVAQGLELVANEMPAPISEEVSQVLGEMGLGSSFGDALLNLNLRIRSYDLDLTVTAMLIQGEVGGNLSEVLDNISHTIRQRIQMQGEVQALTGEVRISAWILALLPPVMAAGLFFLNQSYMMELFVNPAGQMMLVAGVVMEVLGVIVINRMANIEI